MICTLGSILMKTKCMPLHTPDFEGILYKSDQSVRVTIIGAEMNNHSYQNI